MIVKLQTASMLVLSVMPRVERSKKRMFCRMNRLLKSQDCSLVGGSNTAGRIQAGKHSANPYWLKCDSLEPRIDTDRHRTENRE